MGLRVFFRVNCYFFHPKEKKKFRIHQSYSNIPFLIYIYIIYSSLSIISITFSMHIYCCHAFAVYYTFIFLVRKVHYLFLVYFGSAVLSNNNE